VKLPPPPWIVGHRGAAGERLENTLASFRRAVDEGADMVEVDVQLTRDGRLAVVHDLDLRRLARRRIVVERAALADLQAERLDETDEEARIPELDAALDALPPGFPVNVEIKRWSAPRPLLAEAVAAALAGRANVLVSSFDWVLLAEMKRRAPHLPLAPLSEDDATGLLAAGRELGAWSLHCHRRLASRELAAAARDAGRPLLAYTVNDPAEARRLFGYGISGVFTDFPGTLRRALAGAGEWGSGG